MTHLDYVPIKHLRKPILLSPIGRHSAQFCSVSRGVFTRGFLNDMCDIKLIRSGSQPSSFSFLSPTQGKQNLPSLKTDCAPKSAARSLIQQFLNSFPELRPKEALFSELVTGKPPTACIVHIPILQMVLGVFLPRLHPPSDILFAR